MSTGLELGPGTLLDEDCKIVDKNGTVYTSAVITIDIDRLELRIVCPGSVTASKAVPDLPRRCFLTKSELIIQSSVVIPTTYYEIFVQTTQGNWTIPFSITAKECQYGKNTALSTSSDLVATLSYNGTVYAQGNNNRIFCIPLYNYHYTLNCSTSSFSPDCLATIYHMNSPCSPASHPARLRRGRRFRDSRNARARHFLPLSPRPHRRLRQNSSRGVHWRCSQRHHPGRRRVRVRDRWQRLRTEGGEPQNGGDHAHDHRLQQQGIHLIHLQGWV